MKKNIIIAIVIGLTAAASVRAAETPQQPQAPQKKTVQQNILAKYDANHNGVLDPEEKAEMKKAADARKQERLARFDKNGDGKLDKAERRAARSAERKGRMARN